ncbi:MAG: single-stranded-DNA-specific exonuclease RecJ [Ruminococcus sp.]|jgi:single-stranded-DNA-specific exonuclease|nr:single-stranded-DNA-specific exonuclease RecJ [Ruminococcus sp.]
MKKWIVRKANNLKLADSGLEPIAVSVLAANGIESIDAAKQFFGGETLSDPFLITDMEAAVTAINEMVFDYGERVCVYGDYDCDGVCAAVLLYTFLLSNGADVIHKINSREQGFGLNADVIKELHDDDVKLIITVDNGIAAIEEAKLIKSLGMSLIITDHHEPGETLPEALAVVNPHRADNTSPFRDYCGCGVALMLAAALMGDMEAALEQFSDISALATVADMVSLTGENRTIVNHGLHYFEHTENPGLKALIEVSRIKPPITSQHFGFALGPRINAAGRIGHADLAFDLLICEDPEKARALAEELNDLNVRRKAVETEVLEKVKNILSKNPQCLYRKILVLSIPNANHGVIGLAAGRIAERTGKPVFLMTDDENETLRGSARSFPGYSVADALTKASDCLTKFGGHALAGGFSLKNDNFGKFAETLEKFTEECNFNASEGSAVQAIKILSPEELTFENGRALTALEPFGQGFTKPLFILRGAIISALRYEQNYVKTALNYGNERLSLNIFKIPPEKFTFNIGDKVDILTYFGIRYWNDKEYLSFDAEDIRLSGISQTKIINGISAYEKLKCGDYPESAVLARVKPSREDFALIYRQLQGFSDRKTIPVKTLIERNQAAINSFKLLLILDIFEEAGLCKNNYFEGSVTLIKNPPKAKLEETKTSKLIENLLNKG